MSLKAFHVFFILVSTLFAFGFGVWGLAEHHRTGAPGTLGLAVVGIVAGGALVAYGLWFLRKLKGMEP
ncbi:MAG: hypothetical protein NVS2B9_03350 [Myxococcales bacterium]